MAIEDEEGTYRDLVAALAALSAEVPPSVANELEGLIDVFNQVGPLQEELDRTDPAPTAERRAEIERELASTEESWTRSTTALEGVLERVKAECDRADNTPDWQSGTELATFTLGEVGAVRFVEAKTPSGDAFICLVFDRSGPEASCTQLMHPPTLGSNDSRQPWAAPPLSTPAGSLMMYFVALPTGHPRPVTVQDSSGVRWPSAEPIERDTLVFIDPEPVSDPGAVNSAAPLLRQALDVLGPDGTLLTRIVSPPPAGPYLGDWSGELADCYRANGLAYTSAGTSAPPSATPPSTPLPGDAALAAWRACQHIFAKRPDADDTSPGAQPAYIECMVAQGWLPPFWFHNVEQWGPTSASCGRDPEGP